MSFPYVIKSLGKNVNHYMVKKVLFTSATNKTSVMKQRLQEAGAEIYQIPTFKKGRIYINP